MIDLEQVLGLLAQLVVILAGIGGLYLGLKKWIRNVSTNTTETAHQLQTSNGHTIGQYIETTARQIEELSTFGQTSRILIEQVSARLDAHLTGHAHEQ